MLFEKVKKHKNSNLPFVVYSKPNSKKVIGLFQKNEALFELENQSGFAFVSFDNKERYIIPEDQSDIYFENISLKDYIFTTKSNASYFEQDKVDFENLVSKAIQSIENQKFEKVVLSRVETVLKDGFDIELSFKKARFLYQTAFVYCFYHPKIGMYFGATPEQFVNIQDAILNTVALAGTQVSSSNVVWEQKEINEQAIVTEYIVNKLKLFSNQVETTKPYTHQAGTLVHIKTDIKARVKSSSIMQIIENLHPTPAVCGFPKNEAYEFITQNENYCRAFYTGFLGEWNKNFETYITNQFDLYVNLRCMKIEKDKALIYVGCGINSNSNPEKEFLETVDKSGTMKNILV